MADRCYKCGSAHVPLIPAKDCLWIPETHLNHPYSVGFVQPPSDTSFCLQCRSLLELLWAVYAPKDILLMGVGYIWLSSSAERIYRERLQKEI